MRVEHLVPGRVGERSFWARSRALCAYGFVAVGGSSGCVSLQAERLCSFHVAAR